MVSCFWECWAQESLPGLRRFPHLQVLMISTKGNTGWDGDLLCCSLSPALFSVTLGFSTRVLPSCNLTCFSKISLYDPVSSVLNNCFIYFICVRVISKRRVNLVSVNSIWLETELMPFNFTSFSNLKTFKTFLKFFTLMASLFGIMLRNTSVFESLYIYLNLFKDFNWFICTFK